MYWLLFRLADSIERPKQDGRVRCSDNPLTKVSISGEVPCGCSEHLGRTVLNDVYNASVETMFQLLLTDSSFYREFMKARKAVSEYGQGMYSVAMTTFFIISTKRHRSRGMAAGRGWG